MSKTVHRNVNDHEKGAVTLIEAVIVFPIMFIIVFIMMMAGNAYYQQARVERAVVETTLNASARCADPLLGYVIEHESVPTGTNSVEIYPYRYLFPGQMNNIRGRMESELIDRINSMKSIAFKGMEPRDVSVSMKLKWYVIASFIETDCSFRVELPIRMLFSNNNIAFRYEIHLTEPIGDAANLIRNTSMVVDFVERSEYGKRLAETGAKIQEKTKFLR